MNEILVSTLKDAEHQVQSVFSGQQAVDLCHNVWFDLVITDVRLPGIDGVETLAQLKNLQPALKCIVITGYASEDTPVRAIRLNVDDYLFKPFSLRYFLDSVERVLNQEKEDKEKLGLFESLFSRFGLKGPGDNAQLLESVVEERQEAFRGLYVGIRSGHLSQSTAAEIYTSLESLENAFRQQLHSSQTDNSRIDKLRGFYADIHERLALLNIGASVDGPTQIRIPAREFEPLFLAIKDSSISFGDLLYAPLLRKMPDSRFETLHELSELKKKLWPGSGKARGATKT